MKKFVWMVVALMLLCGISSAAAQPIVTEPAKPLESYKTVRPANITASGSFANLTPEKLIDGLTANDEDGWVSDGSSAESWVRFSYEEPMVFQNIYIFFGGGGSEAAGINAAVTYDIEASNDGEHWTVIKHIVGPEAAANNYYQVNLTITDEGAYQYMRLHVYAPNYTDGRFTRVKEIEVTAKEVFDTTKYEYLSLEPNQITVSDTFTGGDGNVFDKARLIDGHAAYVETDSWVAVAAGVGAPYWAVYDFGQPVTVGAATVQHEPSAATYDFAIQASNNNRDWVTVEDVKANQSATTIHTFEPETYRYWRLYITQATLPGGDNAARIGEFSLYAPTDYQYQAEKEPYVPAFPATEFTTATPESQGIDPAGIQVVQNYINAHSEQNIRSFLVMRNGYLVHEEYFGGDTATTQRMVYSCTKSVVSILTGMAIEDGYLTGIDQKVYEFFPNSTVDAAKKEMTIYHLLTMTSGAANLAYDASSFLSTDFGKTVFESTLESAPGSRWVYNNTAVDLLANILQKATGRSLKDYAQEKLFGPLGITNYSWLQTGSYYFGGFGIYMSPRELMRLGYFCLNEGKWDGQQLVPAQWMRDAQKTYGWRIQGFANYGYLFWKLWGTPGYDMWGTGEQRVFIVPEQDLVVVYTTADGVAPNFLHYLLPYVTDPAKDGTPSLSATQTEAGIEVTAGIGTSGVDLAELTYKRDGVRETADLEQPIITGTGKISEIRLTTKAGRSVILQDEFNLSKDFTITKSKKDDKTVAVSGENPLGLACRGICAAYNAQGALQEVKIIELPAGSFQHDFAFTNSVEQYQLFVWSSDNLMPIEIVEQE